jgi:tripeptide aminopeptidase
MNMHERALDLACELQQIPSPTFQERERAEFVRHLFTQIQLDDVGIDSIGNVWSCLPGGDRRPVVVSAHLDTVYPGIRPIPLIRDPGRITGPAIGDNALGLSALITLAEYLAKSNTRLPGPIFFIGSVGEEGLGNLAGMHTIVDMLGNRPIAYIILEGIGLGSVFHRGLGVERYELRVETPGGHSWADYGVPSAVHELAQIITRLSAFTFPRTPRTTFNVGTIQGGTSVNTIAISASCTIDLRSENHNTLRKTAVRLEQLIETFKQPNVSIEYDLIGTRPAGQIPDNHPLVLLTHDCLRQAGIIGFSGIGSTDANVPLSRGYPAVCIGITTGGNAHTPNEFILTKPVKTGMQQLFEIVQRIWEIDRKPLISLNSTPHKPR